MSEVNKYFSASNGQALEVFLKSFVAQGNEIAKDILKESKELGLAGFAPNPDKLQSVQTMGYSLYADKMVIDALCEKEKPNLEKLKVYYDLGFEIAKQLVKANVIDFESGFNKDAFSNPETGWYYSQECKKHKLNNIIDKKLRSLIMRGEYDGKFDFENIKELWDLVTLPFPKKKSSPNPKLTDEEQKLSQEARKTIIEGLRTGKNGFYKNLFLADMLEGKTDENDFFCVWERDIFVDSESDFLSVPLYTLDDIRDLNHDCHNGYYHPPYQGNEMLLSELNAFDAMCRVYTDCVPYHPGAKWFLTYGEIDNFHTPKFTPNIEPAMFPYLVEGYRKGLYGFDIDLNLAKEIEEALEVFKLKLGVEKGESGWMNRTK